MNITDVDDKIINKTITIHDDPFKWPEISQKYEKSFLEDMINLNIDIPDMITRVSDHINEIIIYISGLIDNNYAYVSYGSVYFESGKFYESFNDGFQNVVNEFDTEILDTKFLNEKKDPRDFALWKTAKDNEPSWSSPWADKVFGSHMSIHSGGVDLKFPHHENERKQHIGKTFNEKWVEAFIHIGHLHIEGKKMSKSLKNFITIKDVLHNYTQNELRLFCLMHKYSDNIDFSNEHMD